MIRIMPRIVTMRLRSPRRRPQLAAWLRRRPALKRGSDGHGRDRAHRRSGRERRRRSPTSRSSARPISARPAACRSSRVRRGAAAAPASSASTRRGLTEVVVTRASRAITAKRDRGAHRPRARRPRRRGGGRQSRGHLRPRGRATLHVEPRRPPSCAIARLDLSSRAPAASTSRFELPGSARGAPAAAALHRHRSSRPSRRSCLAGDLLGRGDHKPQSDVAIERRPRRPKSPRPTASSATDQALIGLPPSTPLRPGQVLRSGRPDEGRTSSRATSRHHRLTRCPASCSPCAARRSKPARVGDVVNVLNIQSKRTVQATVRSQSRRRPASSSHASAQLPRVAPGTLENRRRQQHRVSVIVQDCISRPLSHSSRFVALLAPRSARRLLRARPARAGSASSRRSPAIENPTAQPGYKPVQMPMPTPQPARLTSPNSLWRTGSRAFFKDQRAHQVGDILTVKVNITDKATIDNETQRSRQNNEDSGVDNFFGQAPRCPVIESALTGAASSPPTPTHRATARARSTARRACRPTSPAWSRRCCRTATW